MAYLFRDYVTWNSLNSDEMTIAILLSGEDGMKCNIVGAYINPIYCNVVHVATGIYIIHQLQQKLLDDISESDMVDICIVYT